MRIAIDTSVLVAALLEGHAHHARARIWLKAIVRGQHERLMTWHAVAETWSVLTRLPPPLKVSGEEARQALEKLRTIIEHIELDSEIYEQALIRCCAAKVSSGAVFDAIHIVAAERARADLLLTFNLDDFTRLVEEKSPRIIAPPDPPGLDLNG